MLTPEEQTQFREEFQQKEAEIQRNIAVYLSALVVIAGWVFGPQARPIFQILLGNDGANIFAVFAVLAVNVVFTCFLVYKSIEIHEIMQFVVLLSPSDSALQYWESWRRSPQSLTKKFWVRQHYMVAIGLIPFWVSVLMLWGTHHLIWQSPVALAQEIYQIQAAEPSKSVAITPSVAVSSPWSDNLARMIQSARIWWRVVFCFHYIPLLFFAVTWIVANRQWVRIRHLKSDVPDFHALDTIPNPAIPPFEPTDTSLVDLEE
jgi:hypothetical protein